MSYQAGSAFVSIKPDMSTFQDDVKAGLSEAEPQFTTSGTDAGKAFASAFQDQLKTAFADLPDATVKASADTTKLDADLDAATKDRTATVKEDADTTAATAKLAALQHQLDVLKAQKAGLKVTLDSSSLDVSIAKAEAELDALSKKNYTVKVKAVADTSAVSKVNELLSPAVLAGAGLATALGPTAAAAALAVGGIGVAFGAAAATAGAFGAVAVPMFTAVTTAQKALTTAQAAYDKATTPAARTAALAAEQAALAKLTPAEKDLLTQVNALEGGWKKLTQAEQPVVESALTPWLQTATSSMGLLTPLIEDGAGAVHLLGTEAQTALQSPFWGTFSNTLGTTGQIALTAFGTAAGELGDGVAHLFTTFAPDIDNLLTDIPTLAGYFDTWAKSVTSGGLENFFATTFSHANLQALGGDLKNVGSFLTSAATASGQMSGTAFAGLTNVLDVLGRLTPTEIEALTALFLAIKGIAAAASAFNAASNFLNSAAGKKITGLFGTTADAAADGAAEGKAAGAAASAAWKESFDPWAASLEDETGAESAGEAAGIAFTAAFTEAIEAGMPKSLLAIEAAEAPEAKALGAGLGAEAAASFDTAFPEGKVIPGTVVKDDETPPKEKSPTPETEKTPGKGIDGSGIANALLPVVGLATALQTGASAASNFVSKPGTAQGKAAKNIQHANTQVTGLPTGPDPASIATGFEGFATVEAPKLWSEVYQGFETNVGSPIANWFTTSLPNAFISAIPRLIWSPVFEGFMRDIGSPIAAWFTNSLPHFFDSAGALIEGWGKDIGNDLVIGWDATEGAVTGAFDAAKTWVTNAFGDAVSWLTAIPGEIEGGLVTAWNATEGAVAGAFGAAKTWVVNAFSGAVSWLSAIPGEIEGGLVKAWDAFAGAVTSDFGKAKTWVTSAFSGAASWLAAVPGEIEGGIVKGWDALGASVTADFAKAKTWVTGAFSGASSWLVSIGEDVVSGLYNGLISDGSLITSAASYLANLIPSTVKSLLGINSPAKVMIPLGSATPEGLALGMDNGASFITDAGSRLTATTVASLSGLANAQSLAALGVPSIGAGTSLPGVSSPLSTGPLQLQLSYVGSGNAVTDAIVGGLQAHIQGNAGGDVQAALGRGPVRVQ